ncbi:MAG: hemolysin III family protein [Bacteroidota bacterium]
MKESTKEQSDLEEWFNLMSHGITGLTAIGGLVILIILGAKSNQSWSLFSALFYGVSLVLLYTFSSIYHGLKHQKAKYVFNILDHCAIYLLIAGTYTPVLLLTIGGPTGWLYFGIQWSMALIGIIIKIFHTGKYNIVSTLMYAVMGWTIIFEIDLVKSMLPPPAFWLLVSGGITYTVGIIFYIVDYRMRLAHFIWHLFVMAGSLLHYIMMVMYIFE